MYSITNNDIIKFTATAFKVDEMSLPPYSCKYSNHIYTQHQHMALLCLKERLRLKYRELVQLIDLTLKIRKIIGLKKTPPFTTLKKLFQRLKALFKYKIQKWWEYTPIRNIIDDLFKLKKETLSLDQLRRYTRRSIHKFVSLVAL